MRVPVTGFAPFGSNTSNPSTDVAHALHGTEHEGAYFVAFAPLPVLYGEAASAACMAALRIGAGAIVSLGLAATSTHVRIERQARDPSSSITPDAAGRVGAGLAVERGEEDTLLTSLDVDAIAREIAATGIDCASSDDAGDYVCNDLYYRLLAAARRNEAPSHILFVHVPSHAAQLAELPGALACAVARALKATR